MWGAVGRGLSPVPSRPTQFWKGQSLGFKNPDPEFWRRIVKDSSLETNSLGRKKKKKGCLGKRPRIPRMEPDTDSGCIKQRLFLDFLSELELGVRV